MAKYIGRLVNVGFGIESTRGTATAVTNWQPKTNCTFDETMETIQDESAIGVITDTRGSDVVKSWAEGDVEGNVEVNSIGYVLLALLGKVTSAVATTGAYSHEFELLESNSHKSLTIGVTDPVIGSKSYPLAMVDKFTLSAKMGEYATYTVSFKAKPGESATHTVAYNVDYTLLSRHSIFKAAANLAGLAGASASCLESFEITFSKNLEEFYCLGSKTPSDFLNKQFNIEGTFTAAFDSTTFRDLALAGTERAISFELTDSDTTIGVSSKPSLKIELPLASFTEFSREMGNDDIVKQTLAFRGLYSLADSASVSIVLVNTRAAYTA